MDPHTIYQRVQTLSDIQLALLLSIMAKQHCLLHTEPETLQDVAEEIKLVRNASPLNRDRAESAEFLRYLQRYSVFQHKLCNARTGLLLMN